MNFVHKVQEGVDHPIPEQVFGELVLSEHDVVRLKAVQALRSLKTPESLAVLIQALHDDDADVRVDAAEALGDLARQEAIAPLMENLVHDPCGDVKLACVNALAHSKAAEALPVLRKLVTGRGDHVEWDGDEIYQDEWDIWLDIQLAAIRALGRMRDVESIEPIVQAVYDPEGQELDVEAAEALGRIGQAAVPTLGQFASSASRRRRFHAVRALSTIEGEKARDLLFKATRDEDASIRTLAYETLLDRDGDLDLFERALNDRCEDVRIAALSRLNLDDGTLMDRVLRDPSPRVQLALVHRFDKAVRCDDPEEISFKVLDFLSHSEDREVSATAFGTLAGRAPGLVSKRLEALFSDGNAASDDHERRQWAVVDCVAQSSDDLAVEWLQTACHSPYRAVRLKALAALGHILSAPGAAVEKLAQTRELILSLALKKQAIAEEAFEDEPEADDRLAIEDAGLDIGDDDHGEADGPTSSLGAILGQDALAKDLVDEANLSGAADELTQKEQALLARARRNLSRRKVSLDGDKDSLDHEMRLTAIQFLGGQAGMQDVLAGLAMEDQTDIAAAALNALTENIRLHTLTADTETTDTLIARVTSATHSSVRLAALRLAAQTPELQSGMVVFVRSALKDGDASIRAEALRAHCALNGGADKLVKLTSDPSSVVRQQAMRLLAQHVPERAEEKIFEFLIENPEQSIATYLAGTDVGLARIRDRLIARLTDDKQKSAWPIMIPALAWAARQ